MLFGFKKWQLTDFYQQFPLDSALMGAFLCWIWRPKWQVSRRAWVLDPGRESARFICQFPVSVLQDECCCFRLPLSGKNPLLVSHHTGDPCTHTLYQQAHRFENAA